MANHKADAVSAPEKGKATTAEARMRTDIVFKMLVKGASTAEILQFATENWDISERQGAEYIRRANVILARRSQTKHDTELGKAVERLTMLFQSALKLQDYKTCLAVQRELSTLLGLHAPTRSELTGAGGGPIKHQVTGLEDLSDDDLDAILNPD